MRKRENFVSIDLELNQAGVPKIIQIGAVAGNPLTGQILDRISLFVDPKEPITEFITNLTGITQKMVDGQPDLLTQFRVLRNFCNTYDCFCNPIVWGGGYDENDFASNDVSAIRRELSKTYSQEEIGPWPFGRRLIDVKVIYQSWKLARNHSSLQGGLKSALKITKTPSSGRHHNALVDAENTFNLYSVMLKKLVE